jgi:hypothetical protein
LPLNFAPYLQFGYDPAALLEWFLATVGIIVVVALVYVFVLQKSPPPSGVTMAKLEQQSPQVQGGTTARAAVSEAESFLTASNFAGAVESSARAISLAFSGLLASLGQGADGLGIADAAYLVQSKSSGGPDIVQPIYQLNNLRLQALRGQSVNPEEAAWAVNFAKWLIQAIESNQIKV